VELDGFALPVKKLKGTDPVEMLDLSCKNLGVASAVVIASLISFNCALTSINLSENHLTSMTGNGAEGDMTGIKELAAALGVNGTLTSLDLSSNQLCGLSHFGSGTYTAEGITAIADALRVNGGLTSLDLSNNLLCGVTTFGSGTYTAEGITAIAEALRVNGALTSLNLSSNNLCSVTETGYIKASQVRGSSFNEGDKVVYLGKEMIVSKAIDRDGDIKMTNLPLMSGLNALANALRVNGALTMCDLRDNYVGEEGKALIRNALEGKAAWL
jgi:hypothetical protein